MQSSCPGPLIRSHAETSRVIIGGEVFAGRGIGVRRRTLRAGDTSMDSEVIRPPRKPRPLIVRLASWPAIGMLILATASGFFIRGRRTSNEEPAIRSAVRSGRYDEASKALGRWLKDSPDKVEPHLWKARIALALRRPEEAEEGLNRARALGCDRNRLDVLRAVNAVFGGRFTDAEPVLRAAFNDGGEPDPLVEEALAKVYLESYDFPRASLVVDRWMRDSPDDPKPCLWRAEMDVRSGVGGRAMTDYREALRRDPGSPPAHLGLAEELRKTHRNDEAAVFIGKYLVMKPDDPAGHLCAGRVAREQADDDAAVTHFDRASTLDPKNAEAHGDLADLLLRRGQFEAALARLDKAVAIDPFDLNTRYNRGIALSQLGKTDEANAEQKLAARLRTELNELLAAQSRLVKAPGDLEARLKIARWMFSHGKADAGIRWVESILRIQPNQPPACRLLAEHYAMTGQSGLANFYKVLSEKN